MSRPATRPIGMLASEPGEMPAIAAADSRPAPDIARARPHREFRPALPHALAVPGPIQSLQNAGGQGCGIFRRREHAVLPVRQDLVRPAGARCRDGRTAAGQGLDQDRGQPFEPAGQHEQRCLPHGGIGIRGDAGQIDVGLQAELRRSDSSSARSWSLRQRSPAVPARVRRTMAKARSSVAWSFCGSKRPAVTSTGRSPTAKPGMWARLLGAAEQMRVDDRIVNRAHVAGSEPQALLDVAGNAVRNPNDMVRPRIEPARQTLDSGPQFFGRALDDEN